MDELLNSLVANLPNFLFWIFASVTALCAIAVVVSQNIVRAATWLLFSLGGAAAIFFLLGADFVGATQLLVYVGGTLVLVIFGVMLTAQGPFLSMNASAAEWAISAIVGLLLLSVLVVSIVTTATPAPRGTVEDYAPKQSMGGDAKAPKNLRKPLLPNPDAAEKSPYADVIGLGFVGVGVGPAHNVSGQAHRPVVRMNYLLPFEIVSVHLLVVLIGAAYLARAKRRAPRPQPQAPGLVSASPPPM
jgi:NADH-quinone oxidoreductase subunit J